MDDGKARCNNLLLLHALSAKALELITDHNCSHAIMPRQRHALNLTQPQAKGQEDAIKRQLGLEDAEGQEDAELGPARWAGAEKVHAEAKKMKSRGSLAKQMRRAKKMRMQVRSSSAEKVQDY